MTSIFQTRKPIVRIIRRCTMNGQLYEVGGVYHIGDKTGRLLEILRSPWESVADRTTELHEKMQEKHSKKKECFVKEGDHGNYLIFVGVD